MVTLIEKGNIADGSKDPMDSGFGTMSVNGGSRVVVATDAYGNKCVDAFMMGIPLKSKINISQSVRTNILNNEKETNMRQIHSVATLSFGGIVLL